MPIYITATDHLFCNINHIICTEHYNPLDQICFARRQNLQGTSKQNGEEDFAAQTRHSKPSTQRAI